MGSELLERLAAVDARASAEIDAARAEAEKIEAALGGKVRALEAAAEAALAAELAARGRELAAERGTELAGIEEAGRRELEKLAAIPDAALDRAAGAVARALTAGEG